MAGSLRGWHIKISKGVFTEGDLKTIHDLYKASRVNRTTYNYLSGCVAVELEVGSRSVSSLKVLLDIAQPGKLDDSDHCSKHIKEW